MVDLLSKDGCKFRNSGPNLSQIFLGMHISLCAFHLEEPVG